MRVNIETSHKFAIFKLFVQKHTVKFDPDHQAKFEGNVSHGYIYCHGQECFTCCIRDHCRHYNIFLTKDEKEELIKKYPEYFI